MCKECFEAHIGSECNRPEFDGTIACPMKRLNECDCKGFTNRYIFSKLSDDHYADYELKRYAQKERELIIKIRGELEDTMRKDKSLVNEKNHIIENILTLRCGNTKCRAAYYEFDGCLSVKCNNCKYYFCAVCNECCRDDKACHRHVLTHRGSYYASKKEITDYQRVWRTDQLKKYLYNNTNRNAILDSLKKELEDLSITL